MNARRINSYLRYMHAGRNEKLDRHAEGMLEVVTITRPRRAGVVANEVTVEAVFATSKLTEDRVSSTGVTSRLNGTLHIREAHIPKVLGFMPREPGVLALGPGWRAQVRGIDMNITRTVYEPEGEVVMWCSDRLEGNYAH